ncbi:MAG: protein translocase subunit SecD [Acidobacteriota bacterium]|nr:MAG: protein translocase subunit SecD [Acidobacteriota bacterium]
MIKNLRTRGIIIGVVTLVSLVFLFGPWNKEKNYVRSAADFYKPANLKKNLSENIRLGLDLRGGTHLVMQVQADDYIKAITEGNRQKAVDELKKAGIPYTDAKTPANGQLVIETANAEKHTEIRDRLLPIFGSDAWEVETSSGTPSSVSFTLLNSVADIFKREATDQAKTIIEQRINQFGVAEPTIQLHGREEDHQILLQMPGVDNPERVKELIKGEARLELKAVVPPGTLYNTQDEAIASLGGTVPSDREVLPISEKRADGTAFQGYYIVEKTPVITGADLRDARGVPSQQGPGYRVNFSLKPGADERFGAWTEKNIGNLLAISLNGQIRSAPSIRNKITDTGEITGSFTRQEAEDLGLVLRSGALPAKIVYLEERTVGPSLGADSIRQGIIASIVGLGLVMLTMLVYYKFSGVNAIVALALNLIILLAGLAMFGATLTLPGIAGVILLIGMAVDSNVLIFERIREELRAGKVVLSAVDTGFNKALVTIIDTHVTTIVSAAFLYFFGTGPVRGFAVTLTIGLLANLFTAIYVSRTMFAWALTRGGRRADTISI